MLRAYKREIVDAINKCDEISSFIPALANVFASKVIEVSVDHTERFKGKSKYGLSKLMRLNFDLITGFSLLPIHFASYSGIVISLTGVGFGLFLMIRRIFIGPEVEGVFTLFAILFIFVGL